VVQLHQWEIFFTLLFFLIGAYLFLSKLSQNFWALLLANFSLTFSTISLACWNQLQGSLEVIVFLPWILYFLYNFFALKKRTHIIFAAIFLGASLNCYIPVYIIFYLSVVSIAFLIELVFTKKYKAHFTCKKIRTSLLYGLISVSFLVIASVPAFSIFIQNKKVVPIARTASGSTVKKEGIQVDE
jgi:uncharacterized membrane protein